MSVNFGVFDKIETMFYYDFINGKKVLKSDLIKDAEAFFTTRKLCIKSKEDDMQDIVKNNKEVICNYLGVNGENLISPEQTHSANIDIAIKNKHQYPETDGLIITEKDIAIFLNFADCTPIILYDEKQKLGGICHAGWRGTAQKIAAKSVEKLVKNYGSNPKDLIAIIGAAIGFCCYNVGEDVYKKLSETVCDFGGLFEIRQGNIFVDLKNINRRQLEETGVERIDVCPYCTVCNNDNFFSYRKENGTTNRHSAVLKLK